MAKVSVNRVSLKVDGLAVAAALAKFQRLIGCNYKLRTSKNKGAHVISHLKVDVKGNQVADVIVFSTGTLTVSASPRLDSTEFERFTKSIAKAAEQSTTSIADEKPLTYAKAKELIDYTEGLNLDDEKERMIALILSDTVNEILLTARMRLLKIQGSPLTSGVPEKVQYIEGKGEAVYMKAAILETREVRNTVVHEGAIPSKSETEKVVKASRNIFENN